MNHPNHDEWVPYLFGESKEADRRRLASHLQQCADCREQLQSWQRSVSRLDAWKLPRLTPPRALLTPFLRLAAAAVFVLAFGVGLGRLTSPRVDLDQARAAITPQIRDQLRSEFAQILHEQLAQTEAARATDYLALKKELDTVAILTDAGLRRTEREIFQLADYAQPANFRK